MVKLTRLDQVEFVLNAELIEHIEATPDTVITLVSGKKWVVCEPVDEILRRVVSYHQTIHNPVLTLRALEGGR